MMTGTRSRMCMMTIEMKRMGQWVEVFEWHKDHGNLLQNGFHQRRHPPNGSAIRLYWNAIYWKLNTM